MLSNAVVNHLTKAAYDISAVAVLHILLLHTSYIVVFYFAPVTYIYAFTLSICSAVHVLLQLFTIS